jgi:hypothetical protein
LLREGDPRLPGARPAPPPVSSAPITATGPRS